MVDGGVTRQDLLQMQDLVLMQQARLHDLSSKAGRSRSAAAVQGLFIDLQKILQPSLTLEIGAHLAPFSQAMSHLGIEAHAFEANPYNHEDFKDQVAQRAPDLRYHHLAISDVDGEATFHIQVDQNGNAKRHIGSNSLMSRRGARASQQLVTVPASRLDSFLAAHGLAGRSFSAWIDVEGALGKVTAGFGPSLSSCLSLIVEVEEKRYWKDQILVGDLMAYLDTQGMVPVVRDFEYPHQYNLVYLRKDLLQNENVRLALSVYLSASHTGPLAGLAGGG